MKSFEKTDREANPHEIARAVTIVLEESPENGPEDLADLLTRMPGIRGKLQRENVGDLDEPGRDGNAR